MTVTKLKQKSYDKLRNNYCRSLKKEGCSSTSDAESDDSSSSGNNSNIIKFLESKYNNRKSSQLLSLLSEGPQVLLTETEELVQNYIHRVETPPLPIPSSMDMEVEVLPDGEEDDSNNSCYRNDNSPTPLESLEEEDEDEDEDDMEVDDGDVLFCGHHVGKVLLSGNIQF